MNDGIWNACNAIVIPKKVSKYTKQPSMDSKYSTVFTASIRWISLTLTLYHIHLLSRFCCCCCGCSLFQSLVDSVLSCLVESLRFDAFSRARLFNKGTRRPSHMNAIIMKCMVENTNVCIILACSMDIWLYILSTHTFYRNMSCVWMGINCSTIYIFYKEQHGPERKSAAERHGHCALVHA